MAKKINVKSSWYKVTATVFFKDESGVPQVEKYDNDWFETSSKRELKKQISNFYADNNCDIIAITDITAKLWHTNHAFSVNATNEDIIAACKEYGLDVEQIN